MCDALSVTLSHISMAELRRDMDKGYTQNAMNCWIAGNI
jgi:hypothetical protein